MQNWTGLLKSGLNRQMPKDPVSGTTSSSRKVNFALIIPYLKKHWKRVVIGSCAILITALLAFPTPLLTRFLIDRVILEKHLEWLVWVVLGFALVVGLSTLAGILERYVFSSLQVDVSVDLQKNLLDHTLKLPKSFFDDKEVGYLMSRMQSDVEGISWFFSQTVVYILTNALRFLGGVVFLFLLEWRLAIAAIIILPLLVFSVRAFSRRMHVLSHHRVEQNAYVNSKYKEALSSVPLIKAFVSEENESRSVIGQVKTARRIALEQTVVGSVASAVFNLVPGISKAFVLVAGVYLVIQGNWTLGSLLAFQSYLGYVYGPALSLSGISLELQNALVSLERVNALMGVVPEETGDNGLAVSHLDGEVTFKEVSFSYDGSENVLDNISFMVHPGERVAIIGASGVGKTTLISLILRFYKPSRGEILFDGIPAGGYQLQALRQRIGLVSQPPIILSGSIRSNLVYGNTDASEDELIHACKAAGIYDLIVNLPKRLEFEVGENGVNLSEGQKQRLSIARALVKDPDILVMDEPTSALDTLLERSIFETLPEELSGKTLFLAAHRLSTIQNADRILVIKDKRLDGFGSHQELIEKNAYYRSIFA